jgi:hypothetical protein
MDQNDVNIDTTHYKTKQHPAPTNVSVDNIPVVATT